MRLQGKLLCTIVPVLTVAMVTLGSVVYLQLRHDIIGNQKAQLIRVLERTAASASAYVDISEINARLYGRDEGIEQYLRNKSAGMDGLELAAQERRVRSLFARMRRSVPDYREVSLLDRRGNELVRHADDDLINRSTSESQTPWFARLGLNWASPVYASIATHPDDGNAVLMVGVPLQLAEPDTAGSITRVRLEGFLSIAAGLDFMQRELDSQSLGEGAHLLLLDANGKLRFDARSIASGDAPMTDAEHVRADLGSIGTALDDLPSGAAARLEHGAAYWFAARAPVFGSFQLVALMPDAGASALAARLGKSVALITLLSIASATLIFYALLRNVVLRPIQHLRDSVTAMGPGQSAPDWRARFKDDELGELAEAFDDVHGHLARSMEQLQQLHESSETLARQDGLTGLPNRRQCMELLDRLTSSTDPERAPFALLFLDLDGFKQINDSEGHAAGDGLLQGVAKRLQDVVPDQRGTVARLGGDEFVVLVEDAGFARQQVDDILMAFRQPVPVQQREYIVGLSIGMACHPEHATSTRQLLRCADMAMYAAKLKPESSWQRYEESIRIELDDRKLLQNELRMAIDTTALSVHYQPQACLATGELYGMEALLRWQHPRRGNVPPDVFIPLAEQTDLIGPLGEQVIRMTCRQWRDWEDAGLAPPRISVNVAPGQFALDVVATIEHALNTFEMPATALQVELTESDTAQAGDKVIEGLKQLRRMGVQVAMDDFGKGHSSLGALATLPIDTLKIDRCFVSGVGTRPRNDEVLSATLKLAAALGLVTVAEGIETDEEKEWLARRGCDVGQGYLLGRPATARTITELLVERAGDAPWSLLNEAA